MHLSFSVSVFLSLCLSVHVALCPPICLSGRLCLYGSSCLPLGCKNLLFWKAFALPWNMNRTIRAPGNCNRIHPVTRMLWISNLPCQCCIPLGLQIPISDLVPMEYSTWDDCVVEGVLLMFPVRLFSFPALDRICGLRWITSTYDSALHISSGRYNTSRSLVLHGNLGIFFTFLLAMSL